MAPKICLTKKFFSPLSFLPVFGSGIRDPGYEIRNPRSGIRDPGSGMGKNHDPGSGINIPDPQHWLYEYLPLVSLAPVANLSACGVRVWSPLPLTQILPPPPTNMQTLSLPSHTRLNFTTRLLLSCVVSLLICAFSYRAYIHSVHTGTPKALKELWMCRKKCNFEKIIHVKEKGDLLKIFNEHLTVAIKAVFRNRNRRNRNFLTSGTRTGTVAW